MQRLWWLIFALAVLSSCNKSAAPASGSASTAPPTSEATSPAAADAADALKAPVQSKTYRVPAGTQISVRTEETIDSSRASEGQTFAAEVTKDVPDQEGKVAIPRGATSEIVVKSASKGGRIRGASDLILDLASVSVDGRRYRLTTNDVVERGKDGVGRNQRTAKFAGGGAAIGAIIGAVAGGGKGAAIGAGSGAGAGAIGEILTKGRSVKVPIESVLRFQLEAPLQVVAE